MSNPLKDAGLSLDELKLVADARGIKGYESMSKDELLNILNPLKQTKKGKKPKKSKKTKTSFKAKIEEIRKEFNESRHKFSKLKIKEIRKNLYKIENEKNPPNQEQKRLKEILQN